MLTAYDELAVRRTADGARGSATRVFGNRSRPAATRLGTIVRGPSTLPTRSASAIRTATRSTSTASPMTPSLPQSRCPDCGGAPKTSVFLVYRRGHPARRRGRSGYPHSGRSSRHRHPLSAKVDRRGWLARSAEEIVATPAPRHQVRPPTRSCTRGSRWDRRLGPATEFASPPASAGPTAIATGPDFRPAGGRDRRRCRQRDRASGLHAEVGPAQDRPRRPSKVYFEARHLFRRARSPQARRRASSGLSETDPMFGWPGHGSRSPGSIWPTGESAVQTSCCRAPATPPSAP